MMHWSSFSEFLAMGGKGFYVWGAFGVTALCLVLEPFFLARRRRATLARLARRLRAEAKTGDRP
ncbi:MAG: heme exporter protein CcmD [Zoogloeaceae bacterium]|jgi:heme exporter protein D|nr:heme exporter protein CcmD [Zoogloeaceae bacterium]